MDERRKQDMATLFARHTVSDFKTWKQAYDNFEPVRQSMGVTSHGAYQADDNPNDITVYHEFDSLAVAHAFAESQQLRDAMQNAGVQGAPTIWFAQRI
jgi:quinol monooxygenase YgiN